MFVIVSNYDVARPYYMGKYTHQGEFYPTFTNSLILAKTYKTKIRAENTLILLKHKFSHDYNLEIKEVKK